jgi:hypothetical protein
MARNLHCGGVRSFGHVHGGDNLSSARYTIKPQAEAAGISLNRITHQNKCQRGVKRISLTKYVARASTVIHPVLLGSNCRITLCPTRQTPAKNTHLEEWQQRQPCTCCLAASVFFNVSKLLQEDTSG